MEKKNNRIIECPEIITTYDEDAMGLQGSFRGVFRPKTEQEIVDFGKGGALKRLSL